MQSRLRFPGYGPSRGSRHIPDPVHLSSTTTSTTTFSRMEARRLNPFCAGSSAQDCHSSRLRRRLGPRRTGPDGIPPPTPAYHGRLQPPPALSQTCWPGWVIFDCCFLRHPLGSAGFSLQSFPKGQLFRSVQPPRPPARRTEVQIGKNPSIERSRGAAVGSAWPVAVNNLVAGKIKCEWSRKVTAKRKIRGTAYFHSRPNLEIVRADDNRGSSRNVVKLVRGRHCGAQQISLRPASPERRHQDQTDDQPPAHGFSVREQDSSSQVKMQKSKQCGLVDCLSD